MINAANLDTYTTSKLDIKRVCLNYEELVAADIPERPKILPWLPAGGLAMVYAKPGVGKTQFALSLAYAVTSSSNFMKWSVSQNTGVLYVDGEMCLSEMRDRLVGFTQHSPQNPLVIMSHEKFYDTFQKDLVIHESESQQALLSYLDQQPNIKLLILDNLSSLCPIREDKSDDWRSMMLPFLLNCRRRGIAVLIIHHSGKSNEQRGTSAHIDHLDSCIQLTEIDEEKARTKFKVEFKKNRNCYGKDTEPFIAESIQENDVLQWKISSLDASNKDKLIKIIDDASPEGISCKEAAEELGVSKSQISKYRKQLLKEGIIQAGSIRSPMIISNTWKNQHVADS